MSHPPPFGDRESGGPFDDATSDVETTDFRSLREPCYAILADLMGGNKEIALFRKFDTLNMFVLLSLQAEILDLQHKLEYQTLRDQRSEKQSARDASKYFRQMWQSDYGSQQWEIVLELRAKLKEYRSTLLEVAQVSSLPVPHRNDSRTLRRWLRGSKDGEGNNFLMGLEADTWDFDKDLASLNISSTETDLWTESIMDKVLQAYNFVLGRFIKTPINRSGMIKYNGLRTFSAIVASVLAAMLPALSTIPLYYEKHLIRRIGIMIGFTTIFALTLAVFTSAKRIEIFSATAAFAAVEVIFIGSAEDLSR